MRQLLLGLLALMLGARAFALPCPQTAGQLTLRCSMPRSAAVAPALLFFDCTATTDNRSLGGANNTFQDVTYGFDYGDTGLSGGSATWAYGSRPGVNLRNKHHGAPVGAHLYNLPINATADVSYTVQVNATDGVDTARCDIPVTVQAPSGGNGFSGTNTICVFNSAVGTGCPAGATQTTSSSITSVGIGSGKRVLFKCGDTFSGNFSIVSTVTKATIGAYGGCENTTTNRPIFTGTLTNSNTSTTVRATDVRIADVNFQTSGQTATMLGSYVQGSSIWGTVEWTLYNLNCAGYAQCYMPNAMTEGGIIQSTTASCGGSGTQCVYPNNGGNTCLNGSGSLNCGAGSYSPANYVPVSYLAILGNLFDGGGMGGGSAGRETFRMSAGRLFVIANNTFENANNIGAVMKIHGGNNGGDRNTFLGQYVEYGEISDNLFTGASGSNLTELISENELADERERFCVVERNFSQGVIATNAGDTKFFFGAINSTVRNNVWFVPAADGAHSDYQILVAARGTTEQVPTGDEFYNNTSYGLTNISGVVGFIVNTGEQAHIAGGNSFAQNNLFYNNGTNTAAVNNQGAGNTVSNNSTNSSLNPAMTNGSGSFSRMLDFKSTANDSNGICVPNYFDAAGLSRVGACTKIGAITAAAPAQ